jgi:hypothetical protein
MDQSTESIPSHNPSGPQDGRFGGPDWWCLPQGAVWPVAVVMMDVLGQHSPQLPTSEDQHPVKHLTPNGAHPPLRIGVRPWRLHWRAQHLDPLGSEDRVERGGELPIPIADQEPEPTDPLLEAHHQVSGLLCDPLPCRMRRHPEHMDPTGRDLDREQDVQPSQEDRVNGEEVHRQCAGGLSA